MNGWVMRVKSLSWHKYQYRLLRCCCHIQKKEISFIFNLSFHHCLFLFRFRGWPATLGIRQGAGIMWSCYHSITGHTLMSRDSFGSPMYASVQVFGVREEPREPREIHAYTGSVCANYRCTASAWESNPEPSGCEVTCLKVLLLRTQWYLHTIVYTCECLLGLYCLEEKWMLANLSTKPAFYAPYFFLISPSSPSLHPERTLKRCVYPLAARIQIINPKQLLSSFICLSAR